MQEEELLKQKKTEKIRLPQQQRSIETKQKLTEAAIGLFREKGYFQTNAKEIAKAAGVATGSFYTYYTDKRQLFVEAYRACFSTFRNMLDEGINGLLAMGLERKELVRRVILLILEAHHQFDFLEPDLNILGTGDEELQQIFVDVNEQGIRQCAYFLRKIKDELRVADSPAVAAVTYFSIRRIIDLIAHSQTAIPDGELVEELADMLLAYLFGPEDLPGK
ncbi:MAG: TetR family transcriptional regulator [Paenibacillaceae bacterium]|jgi:AcrR family transcriptional regulator|nr:TetR family transcriptional regulator [Paenibacillaceae bacterium]